MMSARRVAGLIVASLVVVQSAHAISFNFDFDYDCAGACSDPLVPELKPKFEAAFMRGGQRWSSFIDDDITVDVNVQIATNLGPNVLGGAFPTGVGVNYTSYRDALIEAKQGGPDVDLVSALPGSLSQLNVELPAGATLSNSTMEVSNTLANVLELGTPNPTMAIVLNSRLINNGVTKLEQIFGTYDLERSDGIQPGSWDMETIAIHEIAHGLGFGSNASNVAANGISPTALDLFSFSNDVAGSDPSTLAEFTTAARNLVHGTDRIFDDLDREVPMSNGVDAQIGHWENDGGPASPNGVMDPVLFREHINFVSLNDLRAFELMGFDTANIVLGDVNFDDVVNSLDVAPFVDVVSNGTIHDEVFIRADINRDGLVDLTDVQPFVDLLSSGLVSVPEPRAVGVWGLVICIIVASRRARWTATSS